MVGSTILCPASITLCFERCIGASIVIGCVSTLMPATYFYGDISCRDMVVHKHWWTCSHLTRQIFLRIRTRRVEQKPVINCSTVCQTWCHPRQEVDRGFSGLWKWIKCNAKFKMRRQEIHQQKAAACSFSVFMWLMSPAGTVGLICGSLRLENPSSCILTRKFMFWLFVQN